MTSSGQMSPEPYAEMTPERATAMLQQMRRLGLLLKPAAYLRATLGLLDELPDDETVTEWIRQGVVGPYRVHVASMPAWIGWLRRHAGKGWADQY